MQEMKRPTVFGLMFLATGVTASAAVKTETIEYKDGETVLEGFLAYDEVGAERRSGVIVVHEWWGLNDHPKERARRLAELGYVAFALDMYGKGKQTTEARQAGEWAGQVRGNPVVARQRFEAGLKVLRNHPRVDPARIAAIGFCFGGTVCLDMARLNVDLSGVVSFHGNLATQVPPDEARRIRPAVLVCHGADDPMVPPEQVTAFEKEMQQARANWQLNAYGGAVHSFTNPQAGQAGIPGVQYHAQADHRSWEAMKAFFDEIFRRPAAAGASVGSGARTQ